MATFYALVALCLAGSALAQLPSLGGCPAVDTQANFDINRYLGKWYENQKYFAAFEGTARCVTAVYSNGENGRIKVVNSYINILTGRSASTEATLRIPNPAEASKLKIRYPSMPRGVEGDYFVLGTDYTSYAVVYSCSDRRLLSTKHAWILTREQHPSPDVVTKALDVLDRNNISRLQLAVTDQNC